MTTERIHFRLLQTQCCGSLLCWVNPRFPNYCPECGASIYPDIKGGVRVSDEQATIRYADTLVVPLDGMGYRLDIVEHLEESEREERSG